jgi:hypothetical protein
MTGMDLFPDRSESGALQLAFDPHPLLVATIHSAVLLVRCVAVSGPYAEIHSRVRITRTETLAEYVFYAGIGRRLA